MSTHLFSLVAALAVSLPSAALAQKRPSPALPAMPGEVIVAFKPTADVTRRFALSERLGAAGTQQVLQSRASALGQRTGRLLLAGAPVGEGVQVVRAQGVDAATLAAELSALPEVAYATPNGRKRAVAAPNDPLYAAAQPGTRPRGPDSGQWYLRKPDATVASSIDIEAAWARTRGRADVVVAVLDTGVRFEHPDLGRVAAGGKLLPGYDFVGNATVANDGQSAGITRTGSTAVLDWDNDPSDPGDWVSLEEANGSVFNGCGQSSSSWHGTATSSLVGAAADNGTGMAGSAPGVRVLPVRVLGKCFGTDSDIIAAMRWAAGLQVAGVPANPTPARVINLSLGAAGNCSPAYQAAVDEITAKGVLIVAAAGNSAGGPVSEPANCRGVVGVLALRHVGSKVGFSDLGAEIGIAAPGGNCVNTAPNTPCLYPIVSATNSGSQGPVASTWTDSFDVTLGTSFASPLVAGVAGLMVSQQPGLTPARIVAALKATARPFPSTGANNGADDPNPVAQCRAPASGVEQLQCYCTTALCGAGMLDAGAAVAAVAGPLARIDVQTASPTVGASISLSASGSQAGPAAAINTYSWRLVSSDPGVVSGFSSANNASTATLQPAAAGSFTVELTVTDAFGNSDSTRSTVRVVAPPSNPGTGGGTSPTPPGNGGTSPTPPANGGTVTVGGGSTAPGWVLALALGTLVLRRLTRGRAD